MEEEEEEEEEETNPHTSAHLLRMMPSTLPRTDLSDPCRQWPRWGEQKTKKRRADAGILQVLKGPLVTHVVNNVTYFSFEVRNSSRVHPEEGEDSSRDVMNSRSQYQQNAPSQYCLNASRAFLWLASQ